MRSHSALAKICHSVRWHQVRRSVPDEDEAEVSHSDSNGNGGPTKGVGFGFLSNILSKSASVTDSLGLSKVNVVDATWSIHDGGLVALATGSRVMIEITVVEPDPLGESQHITFDQPKLKIPLKRIGAFRKSPYSPNFNGWTSIEDGGIIETSFSVHMIAIHGHGNSYDGKELARLEILAGDGVITEEIVQHFTNILEWDKERRRNTGDDEDDEDETGQSKGVLRDRAEKAAQFARKELEMRERRRDREQKKAKYMKDSKGLKYTAIAMANKS